MYAKQSLNRYAMSLAFFTFFILRQDFINLTRMALNSLWGKADQILNF